MRHDPSAVIVRPLERADLPAALALQALCYPPFLREDEAAFASRIDVAAPYCLAATVDGALAGYLLAHGWPRESPLAVGTALPREATSEVLYIHDLAVGPALAAKIAGYGAGARWMRRGIGAAAEARVRMSGETGGRCGRRWPETDRRLWREAHAYQDVRD